MSSISFKENARTAAIGNNKAATSVPSHGLDDRATSNESPVPGFFSGRGSKSHFLLGLLHLSQANNLVFNFNFPQAHEEARKWELSSNTQRQVDVLWDQVYCAGRIFRGEGRFKEAKECFERCLDMCGLPK